MTVSIIGAGNMGKALARRFTAAGETVFLASQDTDKAAEVAQEAARGADGTVDVVDVGTAIDRGDVVVFAAPASSTPTRTPTSAPRSRRPAATTSSSPA